MVQLIPPYMGDEVKSVDIEKRECIERKFEVLKQETTKLCFPRFIDEYQKEEIILKEKACIDFQVKQILSGYEKELKNFNLRQEEIWGTSKREAIKHFENLPDSLKINSFYFQELMHSYVQFTSEAIMASISREEEED